MLKGWALTHHLCWNAWMRGGAAYGLYNNLSRGQSRRALGSPQKLGIPQDEVARRLGVTVRTVQNWNKQGSCLGSRRKRRSLFDPYAAYVLKRWKEGCKKGSVLYREIKEKGYRGTERQVYHFLKTLKQEPVELPALSIVNRISVQEALWLIQVPVARTM